MDMSLCASEYWEWSESDEHTESMKVPRHFRLPPPREQLQAARRFSGYRSAVIGVVCLLFFARASSGGDSASDSSRRFTRPVAVSSPIVVTGGGTIADMTVAIHLTSRDAGNVFIDLVSPNQTIVPLWGAKEFAEVGGSGSTGIPNLNFRINESGSTNLVAPYTGTYASRASRLGMSQGLSVFNQTSMDGTWRLQISGESGVNKLLGNWRLEFNGSRDEGRVVILAGGSESSDAWPDIDRLGKLAYSTFASRRFDPDDIFYLSQSSSPVIVDGRDVCDAVATLSNLQSALTSWAAGAPELSVYLVGETMNRMLKISDTETLSPTDLQLWLNTFQDAGQQVNVVMEFSGSGDYLPVLTSRNSAPRIVVGTSPLFRESVLASGLSFSDFMYSEIFGGRTWGAAIRSAREKVRFASGNVRQKVLLDDNGNGIPNEKGIDGLQADMLFVGRDSDQDNPIFSAEIPSEAVADTGARITLLANGVSDQDGVAGVWVQVTSPAGRLEQLSARVNLDMNNSLNRWEGDYSNFDEPGFYAFSFFARDNMGNVSSGPQSRVLKTDDDRFLVTDVSLPDQFEPDDLPEEANYSDLPIIQYHTLQPSDCDRVRFYATTQDFFDVFTIHPPGVANVDTVLELYREELNGELTLVLQVDEFDERQGELAGLDFPSNGFYQLQACVLDQPGSADVPAAGGLPLIAAVAGMSGGTGGGFGFGGYFLGADVPSGMEGINVVVLDTVTETALEGTLVELRDPLGLVLDTATVGASGQVNFPFPQGDYVVEATPTNEFFLPVFDPFNASMTATNELSNFGNPRELNPGDFSTISYGSSALLETTFMGFYFHPSAIVTGAVEDASTCEAVDEAIMQAVRNSDGAIFNRFEWSTYGDFWYTSSSGNFSNNLYLLADGSTYRIFVQKSGFTAQDEGTYTPGLGDVIDLGTVQITSDDLNSNGIPDSWEQFYFSGLIPGTNDPDADFQTDFEEYVAGTNPNDSGSVFRIPDVHATNGQIAVTWTVSTLGKNREYRVHSYDLVSSNLSALTPWMPGAQSVTEMSWTNTMPVTTNEMHVVEVQVP